MNADRNPDHLYPEFRVKVEAILKDLALWCKAHWPEAKPVISEGYRSTARQQELWRQGRSASGKVINQAAIVTHRDGVKSPSNHQSALAVDIVAEVGGNLTWDCPHAFWMYLGHLARAQGLEYGGDWRMRDYPHVEWPESDKSTRAKAKDWRKGKGL
jgi:peptidoglycan L-alanyl-D-glutamate endopeptidase CwlK